MIILVIIIRIEGEVDNRVSSCCVVVVVVCYYYLLVSCCLFEEEINLSFLPHPMYFFDKLLMLSSIGISRKTFTCARGMKNSLPFIFLYSFCIRALKSVSSRQIVDSW